MKEKGLITAYKNRAKELLPILLVSVLWDKPVDENHFMDMNDTLWNEIISISGQHGVLALAFDAMLTLPTELQPSRIIRLQWFNMVCQVENFNERIYRVIFLLDKLFTDAHIPYMLLKGIGIASYYPVPEHRSSGDIDIFVPENAEKAIKIIKNAGAVPDHDTKRHCCLFINGVTVEIHRYCIGTKDRMLDKRYQIISKRLLKYPPHHILLQDHVIPVPPIMFDAWFLPMHLMHHFIYVGIGLRHLCDWIIFLRRYSEKIDKRIYATDMEYIHMMRITRAFGHILTEKLGLPADMFPIGLTNDIKEKNDARRIYENIMYGGNFGRHLRFSTNRKILKLPTKFTSLLRFADSQWKQQMVDPLSGIRVLIGGLFPNSH